MKVLNNQVDTVGAVRPAFDGEGTEGFTVVVDDNGDGLFSLVSLQGGQHPGFYPTAEAALDALKHTGVSKLYPNTPYHIVRARLDVDISDVQL